jgi:hypothetical protein
MEDSISAQGERSLQVAKWGKNQLSGRIFMSEMIAEHT